MISIAKGIAISRGSAAWHTHDVTDPVCRGKVDS